MKRYTKDGKELGFELLASELFEDVVKEINGQMKEYGKISPQRVCKTFL